MCDQQHPPPEDIALHNGDDRTRRSAFLPLKLGPILFPRIRLSFLHRHSTNASARADESVPSASPILQLPEFASLQNDHGMTHHHTFPRPHHSLTCAPHVYLRNSQRELEKDSAADSHDYLRRMSIPLTPNTTINSVVHGPVGAESSTATSTRTSLVSVVTDSLVLGSLLESALSEGYSECN
jgi:hypothetical protein